ncbi:type I restriction enzyme M protein [Cnuella takakiae]|uniref:Type I restriction enzyme M protein n=1 Tax=Cnuella takakiae TaxID=1302690 RepID=A0A1M5HQQ3_9BACT|nr:N-6 DNA methylase [Cnuella takakiae]OLY95641.1 hypothetical protein BUE76_00010 [Cnuella takakiae]SHG18291.1 type I restriction enzyme M protein [Cnuella takakiae]
MELLTKGMKDRFVDFDADNKNIHYLLVNKKYRWSDPEERVRAQIYLQLILEYKYPAHRIDVEVTVPRRTPSDLADIVVFEDDAKLKPLIVVECKKSTVSEAEFVQAIEQGFGNAVSLGANWVWVTTGLKNKYWQVLRDAPLERTANLEATIPRFGQAETSIGKYYYGGVDERGNPAFDLQKVEQDELTRIFGQAHQALWAGGKRNPSEAFDELDKLIFCKLWDEKEHRAEGEPYDVQEFKKEDPEILLKRIKAIYEKGRLKDANVFNEPIRLSAQEVKTVVGYFAGINLGDTDLDSKGRAFEKFIGSYFRGDFGQYFTPREVVEFVVRVLPITRDSCVLDTSCGSGGFLLYALDKVRREATRLYPNWRTNTKQYEKWRPYWHNFAEKRLFGIEISESIARTAKMNMIIHDDGHTNVVSADGLLPADWREPQPGESEEQKKEREAWNAGTLQARTKNFNFQYDRFDFIITNPPFGSSIRLTEQAYLKTYDFGIKSVNWIDARYKKSFAIGPRDSQSTEVLFIEQCYRYLKPGGILAMVVPDGILTNSSTQDIRDWIEEHYRIIAVISLPQDAFKANDAGVKSSVLFLQKWSPEKTATIRAIKAKLQERLWQVPQHGPEIIALEKEKAAVLKGRTGFDYKSINWESEDNLKALQDLSPTDVARVIGLIEHTENDSPPLLSVKDLKVVERTEEFKQWKIDTTSAYNERITDARETLQDAYQAAVAADLMDYPIFMAITEQIGYDAVGRKIEVNELEQVGEELERFIAEQMAKRDHFFA